MSEAITFIKFLATILITNSHYDNIYPISALATGGAIGDALFFMVSGYCLVNNNMDNFFKWYKKRILRIYPSIIITSFLIWIYERYNISFAIIIKNFIYPTGFWFISAIVIFYIIYYFIAKTNNLNIFIMVGVLILIPYFYIYFTQLNISEWVIEDTGHFKWLFYFQTMLLGGYLKLNKDKIKFSGKKDSVILIILLTIYFADKILMNSNLFFMKLQFTTQLLTFLIAYYIYKASNAINIKNIINSDNYFKKIIVFLSKLTLEIYLVQSCILVNVKKILFPLNFIEVTFLIILFGFLVNKLSNFCINKSNLLFRKSKEDKSLVD